MNNVDPDGMFLKKIGRFFKTVGTVVYNGAERFLKAASGSFQAECGFGYGIGASTKVGSVEMSASAYQDVLTFGTEEGKSYTSIKGSIGMSAQIAPNLGFGVTSEYEHRFETSLVRDWDEHTTMSAPWDVYNCPKKTKDLHVNLPILEPIEEDISESCFIGISGDVHFGIGGHFLVISRLLA